VDNSPGSGTDVAPLLASAVDNGRVPSKPVCSGLLETAELSSATGGHRGELRGRFGAGQGRCLTIDTTTLATRRLRALVDTAGAVGRASPAPIRGSIVVDSVICALPLR
jgi:hypothetical protein